MKWIDKAGHEPVFLTKWKDEMKRLVQLKYPDKEIDEKKLNAYLNQVITKTINNPEVRVDNNYRGTYRDIDLLSLIDTIEENDLIIGGGGTLYVQHDDPDYENIMYDYIDNKKATRNAYKAKRKQYADNEYGWIYNDILQNATKIIINSLYGVHGYDGFFLYNRYIAEAITNIGRQIITTAIMTFETFLSNGIKLNSDSEVYKFLMVVIDKYDPLAIDYEKFFPVDDIHEKVFKRLTDMIAFDVSDSFLHHLKDIISKLEYGQLVHLYYVNNLYEFTMISFIYEKIKYAMENIDELKAPDKKKLKEEHPEVLEKIESVSEFYLHFVLYDHPFFDKVRKAMFTDRNTVLYVDTDSNFLGLNKWVQFMKHDILGGVYNKDEKEVEFISVNLAGIFLSDVIDRGLHSLCYYMHTHKEHADKLVMKNEFYLSRIMFVEGTKKRYISNSVLQEGQLLNEGKGKPDIKGFDFRKSVTKPYLREIYTKICEEEILRAEHINVEKIYMKIIELRDEIEKSLRAGESKFFKQANVQTVENYKNPYSIQGVVAVTLWNILNPDYAIELPSDVDIVPIHALTGPKKTPAGKMTWPNEEFVRNFEKKFPDVYARLENDVYNSHNELIRNMGLTTIAKPKNKEIPVPPWLDFIMDVDSIVAADISLISPILKSLGLNSLNTNSSTEYITNIVNL